MSEKRSSRHIGVLACAAVAFVVSCGLPDYSVAPEPGPPPQPPAQPQVVGRLTIGGSTNRAFVGMKVRLVLEAFSAQGRRMNSHQAVVASSNVSVASLSGTEIVSLFDGPSQTNVYVLLAQITMLAPGTAVIRASLQGVSDSVVVQVELLPSPSTALVVDTFTVVEYFVCPDGDCQYLGYAPLLRLREPTGGASADVIAVEFTVPTRTTGWCTGGMSFEKGQSLHVNGIDPYPWNNDLVFFQLNGVPLPEGLATARVLVRDATGTLGIVEATAPIKRGVTNPEFPIEPVGAWLCPPQATTQ